MSQGPIAYMPGDPRGAPTPEYLAQYKAFLNSPASGIPPGVAPGDPAGGWAAQAAWGHPQQITADRIYPGGRTLQMAQAGNPVAVDWSQTPPRLVPLTAPAPPGPTLGAAAPPGPTLGAAAPPGPTLGAAPAAATVHPMAMPVLPTPQTRTVSPLSAAIARQATPQFGVPAVAPSLQAGATSEDVTKGRRLAGSFGYGR